MRSRPIEVLGEHGWEGIIDDRETKFFSYQAEEVSRVRFVVTNHTGRVEAWAGSDLARISSWGEGRLEVQSNEGQFYLKVRALEFSRLRVHVLRDQQTVRWIAIDKTTMFVIAAEETQILLEAELTDSAVLMIRKSYGDFTAEVEQNGNKIEYRHWYRLNPGQLKVHVRKTTEYEQEDV